MKNLADGLGFEQGRQRREIYLEGIDGDELPGNAKLNQAQQRVIASFALKFEIDRQHRRLRRPRAEFYERFVGIKPHYESGSLRVWESGSPEKKVG
jgi:hypothetical protein